VFRVLSPNAISFAVVAGGPSDSSSNASRRERGLLIGLQISANHTREPSFAHYPRVKPARTTQLLRSLSFLTSRIYNLSVNALLRIIV